MAFLIGVVKMRHSKENITPVLSESEQARKHRQKLAKVTETVAPYRLREIKILSSKGAASYLEEDPWLRLR